MSMENNRLTQYLDKNRSYLGDVMDDIRTSGEWLIHLTVKMNFMLWKGKNEKRLMQSKSGKKKSWLIVIQITFFNHFFIGI